MQIPPTMVAEMALARSQATLSMIKQTADMQKAVASIVDEAATIPQGGRGSTLNIRA